jgi:hypothetical protein
VGEAHAQKRFGRWAQGTNTQWTVNGPYAVDVAETQMSSNRGLLMTILSYWHLDFERFRGHTARLMT